MLPRCNLLRRRHDRGRAPAHEESVDGWGDARTHRRHTQYRTCNRHGQHSPEFWETCHTSPTTRNSPVPRHRFRNLPRRFWPHHQLRLHRLIIQACTPSWPPPVGLVCLCARSKAWATRPQATSLSCVRSSRNDSARFRAMSLPQSAQPCSAAWPWPCSPGASGRTASAPTARRACLLQSSPWPSSHPWTTAQSASAPA